MVFMARDNAMNEEIGAWLIDRGCSNHMSGERKLFQSMEPATN